MYASISYGKHVRDEYGWFPATTWSQDMILDFRANQETADKLLGLTDRLIYFYKASNSCM